MAVFFLYIFNLLLISEFEEWVEWQMPVEAPISLSGTESVKKTHTQAGERVGFAVPAFTLLFLPLPVGFFLPLR